MRDTAARELRRLGQGTVGVLSVTSTEASALVARAGLATEAGCHARAAGPARVFFCADTIVWEDGLTRGPPGHATDDTHGRRRVQSDRDESNSQEFQLFLHIRPLRLSPQVGRTNHG